MRLIRTVGEACNRYNILQKKLCYIEDGILDFSLKLKKSVIFESNFFSPYSNGYRLPSPHL
jgi:hypothetical protein